MCNKIRKLRKNKGLTLKDFASELNKYTELERDNVNAVTYSTISRWEKGITEPTLLMWQKMADFFDVSVGYLQGLIDDDAERKTIDKYQREIIKLLDLFVSVVKRQEEKIENVDATSFLAGIELAQLTTIAAKKITLFQFDKKLSDEELNEYVDAQLKPLMTSIFLEIDRLRKQ